MARFIKEDYNENLQIRKLIGIGVLAFLVVFMGMPLKKAGAFPNSVIKDSAVASLHTPSGLGTVFYAYISGPSPEDVASFTATGPSGVFNLVPVISSKERGLTYICLVENSVINNGSYEFVVTDTLGRETSVVKNFTYNSTLPQVDASSMIPQNQAYVGTTTPTLSFDPVPAGNVYYKVYLSDYDGNAFWYLSSITQDTSFDVPSGLLQPNTPYTWYVRVVDSDTDPQNYYQSESLTFYTGTKGLPDLNSRFVMSFEGSGFAINWFGVRNTNVAPWDIRYLKVTSPDSTVYNLDGKNFYFCTPVYYYTASNSPFPMPDGSYTFEIQDDWGHHVTESSNYSHSQLPFIVEDSMSPDNNAYFDSDTLSFSWNPLVGPCPYYYRVRIKDYNNKVIWYDSSPTTETSVTIPVSGNFPRGTSYKWQLIVYDSDTQPKIMTFSSLRTFTINPERPKVMPLVPLLLLDD